MKILFAIQGTGNGHLSRAGEIIPHLLQHGDLDVLVSGTQSDVSLPYIIKYKRKGISFTFGKNGGIDMVDSIVKLRPFQFFKDIRNCPVEDYDLVINDFEPISAWACWLKGLPCFGLSHQASFLSNKTPRIDGSNKVPNFILKHFAPVSDKIGFHFQAYDDFIQTPVIRSQIRKNGLSNKGHITVYLPAYSDDLIIKHLNSIPDMEWHVFSKHGNRAYYKNNVSVQPIHNNAFVESLCSSDGLITNGGFESPAEAMYLHKKIMVIPMNNQYEQLCNAKALKLMGALVVNTIDSKFTHILKQWLEYSTPLKVNYYDHLETTISQIVYKQQEQYIPIF
ncbi:MAG: glycosyltransferase family protein [Bacteroidia bacterium]